VSSYITGQSKASLYILKASLNRTWQKLSLSDAIKFCFSFLYLKSYFWNTSFSFVRLSYNRIMIAINWQLAINWQNFAQVRLRLKFGFRKRPKTNLLVFLAINVC